MMTSTLEIDSFKNKYWVIFFFWLLSNVYDRLLRCNSTILIHPHTMLLSNKRMGNINGIQLMNEYI